MLHGIIAFILIGITLEMTARNIGMARVTLGPLFNSISGSIGEMVNYAWKGVQVIRGKSKTVSNPQSIGQMDVRARLAECSKYWNDTLTPAERIAWEAYALTIVAPTSGPGDIIKPGKGPFSGFTAFVRNNLLLFTSGQNAMGAFLAAAPVGVTPPDAPVGFTAIWATPLLETAWTPGTVPGVNAVLWFKDQTGVYHAQVGDFAVVAAGTLNIGGGMVAKGQYLAFTKMKGLVDCQIMAVDAGGQPSPASVLVRGVAIT